MLTRAELVELMGTTQTRYFHDNFKTVEHLTTSTIQTGYVTPDMHNYKLETGIQANSTARFYYTNPMYNPKYSILQFKVRMNSIDDTVAFFGFGNESLFSATPLSFYGAGILVIGGVVNFFTSNGTKYRSTALPDIDLTDNWLFRIEYDKLYTRPLPIVYPYFDGFRYEKPTREWALAATHGDTQPENEATYIRANISNITGANKYIEFKHITYSEEYAD